MKKTERFISELEIKIQELSVKYNELSPIEKLEVEQYLKTKFRGGHDWYTVGLCAEAV